MKLSDFQYELPESRIAKYPAKPRDASRLFVLPPAGPFRHERFRAFPHFLNAGDVLVVNDTRVVRARLLGQRAGGGVAEVFLLRPAFPHPPFEKGGQGGRQRPDSTLAPPFEKGGQGGFNLKNKATLPLAPSLSGRGDATNPLLFKEGEQASPVLWEALVRPGKRLRAGACVTFGESGSRVEILKETGPGQRLVRAVGLTFEDLMHRHGVVPLPPYIRRETDGADTRRYQTVYARAGVSVAAPTAGLHFTPRVLMALERRGVRTVRLRLDVGPGTFKPVTAEDVAQHRMDPEPYFVSEESADSLNAALREGRRIAAVGTTVTRALEDQLLRFGEVLPGAFETALFIRPGFRFRAVSVLLTNFHLPGSTLLMLVSAFAGRERALEAYREAVRLRYRFYSYGDAMLLWK